MRPTLVTLFLATCMACGCAPEKQTAPPDPYGPVPTEAQIEWQKLEYYMFIHFGPNTFTDVEWGDGREDPRVFAPTAIDCRQWAATASAAGMKAIILTAKHHDGFCLWPSSHSTHTVRESGWKGDVLKELSEACREYGLRFGIYLSPWDRNHPSYGTDAYNGVFAGMLDEVLTGYGEVFEQWFDGANGEGPEGKKQAYDWPMFNATVLRHQPEAVIFSDVGPGCRWVGNERGEAGRTNWSTLNIEGFAPGLDAPAPNILNAGEQGGAVWVPAEADVSIRPGWFYSPSTDDKVKSVEELIDIYHTSVGRGANLLLNVPPDRTGRIHPADSMRLVEFRRVREALYAENLAAEATVKATSVRSDGPEYAAACVTDGDFDTFWAAADGELNPHLEIDLGAPRTFDRLLLSEYIPLGQRVASFRVRCLDEANGEWKLLAEETTIGYKRIVCIDRATTRRLRIEFDALAPPLISGVELYNSL